MATLRPPSPLASVAVPIAILPAVSMGLLPLALASRPIVTFLLPKLPLALALRPNAALERLSPLAFALVPQATLLLAAPPAVAPSAPPGVVLSQTNSALAGEPDPSIETNVSAATAAKTALQRR